MEYKKLTTDFGAPLWVVEMPHVKSVSAGILINVGTRDELWPEQAGLAHAFEHMAFQGTEKFPNSRAVASYIEDVGGDVNAWTWKENTFFYALAPTEDWRRIFIWLCEILLKSKFKPERIVVEMKNILQEIKRHKDNPESYVGEVADSLVYGDHPLGKSTLGIEGVVSGFKRKNFLDWQKRYYHSKNFIFLVAGNIRAQEVLGQINKLFIPHFEGQKTRTDSVKNTIFISGHERARVINRDVEQVNIELVAPISGSAERTTMVLDLFSEMLGAGSSFPLFQEIRDKLGLCYSIGAGVYRWSDIGSFMIYLGTDAGRCRLALDTLFKVIGRSSKSEALLRKTRRTLIGKLKIGMESSSRVLNNMSMEVTFSGLPKSLEDSIREIESVTIGEIQKAVDKFLKPEDFYRAFVAPKGFTI